MQILGRIETLTIPMLMTAKFILRQLTCCSRCLPSGTRADIFSNRKEPSSHSYEHETVSPIEAFKL